MELLFKKCGIIFLAGLVILNILSAYSFAENLPADSKVIIKVDSDGLKAEVVATGRGTVPGQLSNDSPQIRAAAKESAVSMAYKALLAAIEAISPDYFPKERYLTGDGFINGARLIEVRYLGDGSVEADVGLNIALNSPIADRFEKDMRLAGYRVVEYDRPGTEIDLQ